MLAVVKQNQLKTHYLSENILLIKEVSLIQKITHISMYQNIKFHSLMKLQGDAENPIRLQSLNPKNFFRDAANKF